MANKYSLPCTTTNGKAVDLALSFSESFPLHMAHPPSGRLLHLLVSRKPRDLPIYKDSASQRATTTDMEESIERLVRQARDNHCPRFLLLTSMPPIVSCPYISLRIVPLSKIWWRKPIDEKYPLRICNSIPSSCGWLVNGIYPDFLYPD